MKAAEFDKFAEEYRGLHKDNIRASGEQPEFFAEYKVQDLASLLETLGIAGPTKGLDFGGGIGNSIPYFSKHLPDCALTCLDVSARSLEIAEQRFPNGADFVCFDGSAIPYPDATFDFAFSACVFHHIPEAVQTDLMREVNRVLKTGGVFVIFEHNPYNPLTVRAVNDCPFDENAVLIRAGQLKQRIAAAGFSNPRHVYRIFFPGMLRWLRPLEKHMGKLPLGAQYFVYARK